jgi:hypothetical protein
MLCKMVLILTALDGFFSDENFTDKEFREHFRVSVSFLELYNVLRHNPIFSSAKKRRSQTTIQLQLMIFLFI